MDRATLGTLLLGVAAVLAVTAAHGGFNGYSIWNSAPVPFALLPLLIQKPNRGIRFGVYTFSCSVAAIVFAAHLGHLLEIGPAAPERSEESLLFLKLPFLSVGAGYVTAMAGVLVGVAFDAGAERREAAHGAEKEGPAEEK